MPLYNFNTPRPLDTAWEFGKTAGAVATGALFAGATLYAVDALMGYTGPFRILGDAIFAVPTFAGVTALTRRLFDSAERYHYSNLIESRQMYRDYVRDETRFVESVARPANNARNLRAQPAIPGVQPAQPPIPVLPQRYRSRI